MNMNKADVKMLVKSLFFESIFHRISDASCLFLISLNFAFMFLFLGTGRAQNSQISGTVSDQWGKPLSGVSISTVEGKSKTLSGREGIYVLEIDDESDAVIFSMSGYQSQALSLDALKENDETGEELNNVTLQRAETYNLDETVYLGQYVQRRGSFTGSAATVTGETLANAPAPNLSQALSGRLAGLYSYENYSEPSRVNTTLHLRGATTIRANHPLVVIDGFPYSYSSNSLFEYISAMEVEQISVLKDASTQALYGIQGGDGVIVITTKRGAQGKLRVNVKVDQTFEQTSTRLPFIGSDEFVPMRNQAGYNDRPDLGRYQYFSQADEEMFISGANTQMYPNNDWRKINMKDFANMQRVNFNATGGNSKAAFFTNLNFMHQDGMWKTDQTEYNPNNNFIWANFRTNVDVKLNRLLSASLNLSGNIRKERTPGRTSYDMDGFAGNIYYRLYSIPPYVYGPATPKMIDSTTGDVIDEGGGVVVTGTEPYTAYASINRVGYYQHTVTNIYAQFALKLDLSFLVNGLDLGGYIGYQTNYGSAQLAGQDFASWIRTGGYNELTFAPYGTRVYTPLIHEKWTIFYYNLNYKGALNYNRSFGKHHLSGVAYAFYQNLNTADTGSPALLPYKVLNTGLSASYDYARLYLLKFDMGYSGSEQYAKENRFTALPAVSAAWLLSNEAFMEQADWLSMLKLRASFGKTATDRAGLGRYIYLDNIILQEGAGPLPNYLHYFVNEQQAANPLIEPEIIVKQNYGIDITLFNQIAVSAEVFTEKTDNMVSGGVSITPMYQGIPVNYFPRINSGIFENRGYEIALDYSKAINSEISFNFGGWLTYTRNKVIFNDESERAADYHYLKWEEGFPVGQRFGYLVNKSNGNGFFNSRQEIDDANLTYEIGNPRPGDLIYQDLNEDGFINEKDMAPLGNGGIPLYTYAFHINARYRNFDLSVLFQGVADYKVVDMNPGRTEWRFEGTYSEWHKNAWTAERHFFGQKITYPALSASSNSNHQSNSFFLEDKSYLRLKNLTIGYCFPQKVANLITADKIRLYLSGHNLFTWHKLTTKEYGPEGHIWSIPVYRLYNIGLYVQF